MAKAIITAAAFVALIIAAIHASNVRDQHAQRINIHGVPRL